MSKRTAADFFAGIGLVTLGLERAGWSVSYAVDYKDSKRAMYEAHFGPGHYHVRDVHDVQGGDVPPVSLVHGSFPCTDTSVAGSREGLGGKESSAFWAFARILDEMGAPGSPGRPPLVMIENVEGLLSSNNGEDLQAVLETLCNMGYGVDLLLIDATHFVPQSRVRLFILGVEGAPGMDALEQDIALQKATGGGSARPAKIRAFIRHHPHVRWHLRELPPLPQRAFDLDSIIDEEEPWWSRKQSDALFAQMFERHQEKLRGAMREQRWSYSTAFRRMRVRDGEKRSTAEVRSDGVAGCLRTPKGGSARQIVIRAGFGRFDARLLNAHECARLMGAPEYTMDESLSLNDALFGFGDAVCVDVVEWLARHYLDPALEEALQEAITEE